MPNTSGNKIFILLPSSLSTFTLLSYSLFCYLYHYSHLSYYLIPYSVTFIIIHLYPIIIFLILLPSSSSAFTLISYFLFCYLHNNTPLFYHLYHNYLLLSSILSIQSYFLFYYLRYQSLSFYYLYYLTILFSSLSIYYI